MIRINLLGEKVDNSGIYILQMFGFSVVAAVVLLSLFVLHQGKLVTLDKLENEKNIFGTRLAKLKQVTKDVENIEAKKTELKLMLQTISKLKAQKHGPVHLLDELNIAIPDQTWLTTVQQRGGVLEVMGYALDNQTVARFVSTLEKSPYFVNDQVKVNQTKLEEVSINNKPTEFISFSVSAQIVDLLKMRVQKQKENA